MRQFIHRLLFLILIFSGIKATTAQVLPSGYGNNSKVNYIRTWDVTAPEQNPVSLISRPVKDVKQSTQYVDGLGRPLQTVVKEGSLKTESGTKQDIVNPVIYDGFGREQYKFLPYSSSSNTGTLKYDPFTEQKNFYSGSGSPVYGQNQTFYYNKTNFEASPLSRVSETYAPGNSWVGSESTGTPHPVKMKYWINTTTDSVRIWTVTDVSNSFGTYSSSTRYAAGELYKNITIDEHGKQVIEFKDKEGKVVLKKVQLTATAETNPATGSNHSGWLCTYYIYDDLNNLRCVIQPQAVKLMSDANNWSLSSYLDEQCFRYEYDARNRMVRKKVPGAGEVWMVYDARDRLVMTQDANMRLSSQKKWLYTVYDELNRPTVTGLMIDNSNYNNLSYHATRADTSTSYPNLGSYTTDELTRTFYDNYDWRSSWSNPLSAIFDNSYNSYYQSASTTVWPYAVTPAQSNATRGMVTGTRVKILGTSSYLFTVTIYDDKGKVIQVQADNAASSTDIITTQYGWQGLPLVTISKTQKTGNVAQTTIAVSQMTYDDLGRVIKVEKKVSNTLVNSGSMPGTWTVIAENQYDALGQLVKKKMGRQKDVNGSYISSPIDSLTYDYNIRGWMLGANRTYVKDTNSTANYFGFDLGYDKDTIVINGTNKLYTAKQYNGNIGGMLWKSTGDDQLRKYDFVYDAVNRLTDANFTQLTSNSFNLNAGINFSVQGISFDANGNILTMNQKGWKPEGSTTIDSLLYTYNSYSNKLKNVLDRKNDTITKLGDFRSSTAYMVSLSQNKTTAATDYSYDDNGNLTFDKNKDIGTIYYNYLNLPDSIIVTGKGSIKYVYDATGNKIKKIIHETGKSDKTTLYMGAAVYENDTLQFIGQEEGRIRFKQTDSTLKYDYFVKDHLGNVRMVLTEERQTNTYDPASLETATIANERLFYCRVDSGRVDRTTVSGYPTNDTYTNPNTYIQKLSGNAVKIGTSSVLKVMAGDKFNIRVSSWWPSGSSPGTAVNPLNDLLVALITGVGNAPGAKATGTQLQNTGLLSPGATGFLTDQGNSGFNTERPKAFVNWILFDEQFKYVAGSSGSDQVGIADNLKIHTLSDLTISKNGYLYIYVSNETPNINVFFDNLQVTHIRGPILEETHYYPFGLTMSGISSKANQFGNPENKKKFNDGSELQNKEFSDGSGLELYATDFRSYDAQIGRFIQVDALSEIIEDWSPYVYCQNNPIALNDPLGLASDSTITPPPPPGMSGKNLDEIVVVGGRKQKTTPPPGTAGALPDIPVANPNPFNPGLRPVPPSGTPPGKVIPVGQPSPSPIPLTWGAISLTTVFTFLPLYAGPTDYPNNDELWLYRPGPRALRDLSPDPNDPNKGSRTITLYRGVYAEHPDIANARKGMAIPWGGHSDPLKHNMGNVKSIFTSWTIYKSFAARMAGSNGWGGIILTKTFQRWQLVVSPDKFNQGEILVPGPVFGAKVENARPSN